MLLDTPAAAPAANRSARRDGALPAGTWCGGFEIVDVIGTGGFGIVYRARDPTLGREIAIKEYMPRALALRGPGGRVARRDGARAGVYEDGMRAFLAEARLLARFDHRSLVNVYCWWEDRGTAYLAMPRLHGHTLHRVRRRAGRAPDVRWMWQTLDPILQALELLHGAGVLHRDVAPDNILLPPRAPPVLLDMGSAHDPTDSDIGLHSFGLHELGGRDPVESARRLTGAAKRGYAPLEQYRRDAACQGPWTDLYAVGAVLHFLFLGGPPLPPQEGGFAEQASRQCGPWGEEAAAMWHLMTWMLQPIARERPQSVAELRERWDAFAAPLGPLPVRAAGPS